MHHAPLLIRAAAYRSADRHPPAQQVALLCARAIQHLEEAKSAIASGRIEARFHLVMRAHAIVGGLQACLDFERGGEIAPLLDRLYGYVLGRLALINLRNDAAICDELIGLIGRMRDGWNELGTAGLPRVEAGSPGAQATCMSA